MLTATETARVQKFTAEMDPHTASAIMNLFKHTKSGCDAAAYDLMDVAHTSGRTVSPVTVNAFERYGLVLPNGLIPPPIKAAVREAVARRFLMMHGPENPLLKPEPRYLSYE